MLFFFLSCRISELETPRHVKPIAESIHMHRRTFLHIAAAGSLSLTSLSCAAQTQVLGADAGPKSKRPNLVVIMTDDQGYSDVGCYGARGFATPNIDRMAKEGVRFTDFYAAPTCSPSRASLLTGCYAQRVGITKPLNGPTIGLSPNEITLAEHLKKAGYATACIGKWHLGLPDSMSPVAQGFDYFSGIPLSHIRHGFTEHTHGKRAYYKRQWKIMGVGLKTKIEHKPDETLFTQRCTREALAFLRTQTAETPFFLYLAHPQVHKEVLRSKAFEGRTKKGRYGDSCEELDWSVGQVLKQLKSQGLDRNTLVVYLSDNGPWLNQKDQSGSARPLRGGKFSTWEGGMRVPCIMRWAGTIPPGITCREVASVMDIFPTMAKRIGTSMPADRGIDGKDIWPLIVGKPGAKSPHEYYYYYNKGMLMGVRWKDWKLHRDGKTWALYDLKKDVGETTDLRAKHPKIVTKLKVFLAQARVELGDRLTQSKGKSARPLGQTKRI